MVVFVLHPDIDALAAIVGKMRARGMETVHAPESAPLIDRAQKVKPAVLVIPDHGEGVEGAADLALLRNALGNVPEVLIPNLRSDDDAAIARVVDAVTSALVAAAPADAPIPVAGGEVRGDLAQVPLPDLLQLLSMGKKTGTLTVTTSNAAGELRLSEGEVVDAMFRRAEGMKAVIRLLGERDGAFHFAHDAAPALRRIREPMSNILMEGTQHSDEIKRLRAELGLQSPTQLLALHVAEPKLVDPKDAVAVEVAQVLATPCTLEDLLDEFHRPDLELLEALRRLDEAKLLRRLPIGELRPSLAGPEGMVVLRGLARRLRPRGYRSAGRLVLAGSQTSVRLARQSIARLAEAIPGVDAGNEYSGDRLIEATVTLQLGESVALDVYTVIDRPDLIAALPMVLNGVIGVVALDRPSQPLAELVEELEVALVDARSVGDLDGPALDPGDPSSIAAVVRGAIEGMGGS